MPWDGGDERISDGAWAVTPRRIARLDRTVTYTIKSIVPTIQGEGFHTGRAAVFLRFAGCNLWSGVEDDRASAVCRFCDTDFLGIDGAGGGEFVTAAAVAERVLEAWSSVGIAITGTKSATAPFVVVTGGEPLLQFDSPLLEALHAAGFEVAVETNGTLESPAGIDWVVVSPKAGTVLRVTSGDEIKLVYPQVDVDPATFEGMAFRHFYLMPLHDANLAAHTAAALDYCRHHPQWRLTLQVQKLVGMP